MLSNPIIDLGLCTHLISGGYHDVRQFCDKMNTSVVFVPWEENSTEVRVMVVRMFYQRVAETYLPEMTLICQQNFLTQSINKLKLHVNNKKEVPPRLELGLLDSKSRVLTITPRDHIVLVSK
ncbi:hypothetical protein RF11_07680 [Thelohanellus kitauei]|uniref:Uncharacterized protein n=1 Tax=Thelohanellus kitauei TaxID=669202 RepID=A0A0C2MT24_THEKT|nr:hypothetical protein RF11_07680 [Thelohanellus kitauei]